MTDIPLKQLLQMGWIEVKPGLFLKDIEGLKLWRDYRKNEPFSYAYKGERSIPYEHLKPYQAITKIEEHLAVLKAASRIDPMEVAKHF